jgi:hypothetical protein
VLDEVAPFSELDDELSSAEDDEASSLLLDARAGRITSGCGVEATDWTAA